MLVTVSSTLETSCEHAWELVQRSSTLVYITKGMLGFETDTPMPEQWKTGQNIDCRLKLFSIIPAWKHQINFNSVEPYCIDTEEQGGMVSRWNHVITVEPINSQQCRYTDQVEIKAGVLTPLIAGYAYLLYHYRQRRWKRLIRQSQGITH